jgi:mRNA interferase MazF
MTGYSFGDLLLVPFPFTDQSGAKQRPAVVVCSDRYQRERPDLILMPITSQSQGSTQFGDVPIAGTGAAGLLMPGVVKPILFTMEVKLVRKLLGRLADDDQRALRHCIALLIG